MRKISTFIFILLLLLISLGCSNDKDTPKEVTYASEANDLTNFIENGNTKSPLNYSLINTSTILEEEDAVRIEYEVFNQNPKINMNEVIMSFHLEEEMMHYLNTNNVFHTNIFNEDFFDINPTGDIQGASLSIAFILDSESIDSNILELYKRIYIKISYNVDNRRVEDYFKMDAIPSPDLEEYLKNKLSNISLIKND